MAILCWAAKNSLCGTTVHPKLEKDIGTVPYDILEIKVVLI